MQLGHAKWLFSITQVLLVTDGVPTHGDPHAAQASFWRILLEMGLSCYDLSHSPKSVAFERPQLVKPYFRLKRCSHGLHVSHLAFSHFGSPGACTRTAFGRGDP